MRVLGVSELGHAIGADVAAHLPAAGVEFHRLELRKLHQEKGNAAPGKIGRYLPDSAVTRHIREAFEDFRPDVIHISANRPNALAVLRALRDRRTPVCLHHGAIGGLNALSPIEWMTFFNRRIAKVVVPSRAVINSWMARPVLARGMGAGRCHVLPHAIRLPEPVDASRRREIRERLGFTDDDFVVGTVCQIRPIKNLPFAAAVVRDLGGRTVFSVVGAEGRADEMARLRAAGGDALRLHGLIPNASSIMPAFDLYVTPTRLPGESFGLAAGEAMACGVPVLTMNFGGTAEIVEHGISGLTLSADPDDWRYAIATLAADKPRRLAMGRAARQRIETRFSAAVIAAECAELYRAMLAGSPGPHRPAGRSSGTHASV